MWIVAHFQPTSLFSLRPALSTASGAQSLLVPTPFAIKMALLNSVLGQFGVAAGAPVWSVIRDLEIALDLPDMLVVNKIFIKIQRPTRFNRNKPEEFAEVMAANIYPFNPTIAFREFVQFGGEVGIAVRLGQQRDSHTQVLLEAFKQINYLGKRGSFWQLQQQPETRVDLDVHWTMITHQQTVLQSDGTLQILDDCGPKLSWDHVNIYSGKAIKINADERILRPIVLPYRLARSSYRYTLYERIEATP